jgi:hypothetical protein
MNNAIRMMIGIGTPRKNRSRDRMLTSSWDHETNAVGGTPLTGVLH